MQTAFSLVTMPRTMLLAVLVASAAAQMAPDFGKCTCATFCDGTCNVASTGKAS